MAPPEIARTVWAELQVEELLSVPLISEFVFRSPKHNDPDEKEVIDHLIIHGQQSIILSQKAQKDPEKRTVARNELWVLKNIQNALKPIRGVIRNPSDRPKWCEHPRRGRVEFDALPPIVHGVALVETWHPVDLSSVAADLPLEYLGVPLSYLSINDFVNLVVQLRTVPELLEYLNARRTLTAACLHTVGHEWPLFELYLMNGGSFGGCTGCDDARHTLEANTDLAKEALERNAEYRFYSGQMEHVADCLATRDPGYAQGLSDDVRSLFDPDEKRKNYIVLQQILADLRLRERAELGRAFYTVSERVSGQSQGISFMAAHIDGRDRIFLFVATKKSDKSELSRIVQMLARAALAHFQKSSCLVIVDRDGEHYDLALTRPGYLPSAADAAAGQKHFGHLRMSKVDVSNL
jgi:hypothetical protein